MDKEYHKQKAREHYSTYKQQYAVRHKAKREANRKFIDQLKSGGCTRCPEIDIRCLDFHHMSGDKEIGVAGMLLHNQARILKEVAKRVVLCANCHRKVHASKLCLHSSVEEQNATNV